MIHTACLKSNFYVSRNIDDVTSQSKSLTNVMVNKRRLYTAKLIDKTVKRTIGIVAVLYERPLCAYKTVEITVYLRNDAIAMVSPALHAYGYLHEMLYRQTADHIETLVTFGSRPATKSYSIH